MDLFVLHVVHPFICRITRNDPCFGLVIARDTIVTNLWINVEATTNYLKLLIFPPTCSYSNTILIKAYVSIFILLWYALVTTYYICLFIIFIFFFFWILPTYNFNRFIYETFVRIWGGRNKNFLPHKPGLLQL